MYFQGINIDIHIDGSIQDCSNSIANTLKLQQSCTEPSICESWNVVKATEHDLTLKYFLSTSTNFEQTGTIKDVLWLDDVWIWLSLTCVLHFEMGLIY